jgi:hypothetical protein
MHLTAGVDHLEQAAAFEVGAYHRGHDARRPGSPPKSAMATGMRLAPAPVISIVSWASAGSLQQGQHAKGKQPETTQFESDSKHGVVQYRIRDYIASECS